MEELREAGALVVWQLDRFGRSLKDLLSKIESPSKEGHRLREPDRRNRHDRRAGKLTFHIFWADRVRAGAYPIFDHPEGGYQRWVLQLF